MPLNKDAALAPQRVLWGGVRALFPEFVHDVAWNHALCTIKEEVERKRDYTPRR